VLTAQISRIPIAAWADFCSCKICIFAIHSGRRSYNNSAASVGAAHGRDKVTVHFRESFTKPIPNTNLATVNNTEANHEFNRHPHFTPTSFRTAMAGAYQ
jgi:hypothetical protein